MRRRLDLDILFPIKDSASARLMLLKARCLLGAQVITEPEAMEVVRRASEWKGSHLGATGTHTSAAA